MASVLRWLLGVMMGCACSSVPGAEEQAHGLVFEKWLRVTFFEGYEPERYTQKWDIPASANRKHGGIPVNPKVAKYQSPIGMGDALRQFEIDEPFLLIVGFWEQVSPREKRFVNTQAVRVEPETWRKLWGQLTRADLARLNAVIRDSASLVPRARAVPRRRSSRC